MTNKAPVWIIIIIIVIALVVLFFFGRDVEEENPVSNTIAAVPAEQGNGVEEMIVVDTPTENEGDSIKIGTQEEIIVVEYTDNGFVPKEIAVSVGQTVRFVNDSGRGMWVASNVHPTHQIFPEFDQRKTIGTGGIYEFTFTQVGIWNYHNHVQANRTGVVTVITE